MILRLVFVAVAVHGATWTTQSSTIPEFDWVVIDHGDGNSASLGAAATSDAIFFSGTVANTVVVQNSETGESVASSSTGSDDDIYIAKVSFDGTPLAIWTYEGSLDELPITLAASEDGAWLSLVGWFLGTITLGGEVFENTGVDGTNEGIVFKASATDGSVAWARAYPSSGNTPLYGTTFDAAGDVAVTGTRCDVEGTCVGFVALLAAEDGTTIWEKNLTAAIPLAVEIDYLDGRLYAVGRVSGETTLDDVVISSSIAVAPDALLLVLDASDGTALWAATIDGPGTTTVVQVLGQAVYFSCSPTCREVRTTVSEQTVAFSEPGVYGGGVAKVSTDGVPLWTADVPSGFGMEVTDTAVYLVYYGAGTQTYGDGTFTAWGMRDNYIAKFDAETGAGEWVLQYGGQSDESVLNNIVLDRNSGDLYVLGRTQSHPVYFDPLVVDSHPETGEGDLFVAKLLTSSESLPSCKIDEMTVADGHCFYNNVCYDDGEVSRAISSECVSCSPGESQTSLTVDANHCYIDNVCYTGESVRLLSGGNSSECEYCNPLLSMDSWSVRSGYLVSDDGTCTERPMTWTTQSALLPEFDWVVIDHGDGNSASLGAAATSDAIFFSGTVANSVVVQNSETGESVASSNTGSDDDIYIAKVSFDGTPLAIWTYEGSLDELPITLAASEDGAWLSLVGWFRGTISLGGEVFENSGVDGTNEGIVFKASATDGSVAWARAYASSGNTPLYGTTFDAAGDVAVTGTRCDVEGTCVGFVALLAAEDGTTIWEKNLTAAIPLAVEIDYLDGRLYAVGRVSGETTLDDVVITSSIAVAPDALLLVLDASDGTAIWAATIDGPGTTAVVQVHDQAVYFSCSPTCREVRTTVSEQTVTFLQPGVYGGGVAKVSTDGVPLWAADVPSSFGMEVTDTAVYLVYYGAGTQTYGDATFTAWGMRDNYVVKLDAQTGAGEWVLQYGGQNEESALNNIVLDRNSGDLYVLGRTESRPVYFDPLVVDSHPGTGEGDLFVAKLLTSAEALPSCKTDEASIADGYCFIDNICYADGDRSRTVSSDCLLCSAASSQTSMSILSNFCYIDGICYGGGFRRVFDNGVVSVCQRCAPAVSTDAWTILDETCEEPPQGGPTNGTAVNTTWTKQSALLPDFDWVVMDHGDGNSIGYGLAITSDAVFLAGSMTNTVSVTNSQTGAAVDSNDEGPDGDVYITKISFDGTPQEIWTYRGTTFEFPTHLAATGDGSFLAMVGYFSGGNVTFGDKNFVSSGVGRDPFVVKVSAIDGTVVWARHLPGTGDTVAYGNTFDADGNVIATGRRCDGEGDSEVCVGFAFLLAAENGATIWEHDFDTVMENFVDVAYADGKFYLSGRIRGQATIDGLQLSSASDDAFDALMLVLDSDGTASWAAMISGAESSSSLLVKVLGDAVYMACVNLCLEVRSTASQRRVSSSGTMDSVALISTTGEPLWAADLPSSFAMEATIDAVYVMYYALGSQIYGESEFTAWGTWDFYVAKLDAQTGAGQWVMQIGGQGNEYPTCNLAADANGDMYVTGVTFSDPLYFGSAKIDTHDAADGYDLFVAKLLTSSESLPSCKTDETSVADTYCFYNNVCYAGGEMSRAASKDCLSCSPERSQTSLTVDATHCYIDDVCYSGNAARLLADGVSSECEYCDPTISTGKWSVQSGFSVAADGTTCVIDEISDEDEDTVADKIIAGYVPATNVSSHARMDLDAQEIGELTGKSDFDGALFVYENGGNGLCSEEDIQTTDTADSCYGKTINDARGNSVSGSGSVRTIQGFATSGPSKMAQHKWYPIYRDYWGDAAYADTFVQNALSVSGIWAARSDAMRSELAAKGAVYQAMWMYMLHEMEEAIVQCESGNTYASDTSSSAPHRWDEFWAFYAGSLEGVDGTGDGEFMWALAEKRCPQFATCDTRGRTALANERALELAISGLEGTLAGDCALVEARFNTIVDVSTIPLVQGLLKYVYDADPNVNGGSCSDGMCTYDEEWAEGWAFAAALLPRLDMCAPGVAQLVRENLDVDNALGVPMKDGYRTVKAQIETTYSCLGISCADVGAYQAADGVYEGMEACQDALPQAPGSKKKTTKTDHTAVIALAVVLAAMVVVVIVLVLKFLAFKRKTDSESTHTFNKTKNTLVSQEASESNDDASETTGTDVTYLDIEDA